jgi:hypothetical protein
MSRHNASSRTGGVDLAEWLVRSGLALDWPQYSKGAYEAAQLEAERANLGMWAAASKNLGAIGLAEEQADRLLAVPINHGNVRFASHCRRNADIALCPRNLHKRGSPSSLSVAASTSVAVDVLGRFRLARKDDGVHSAIIPKFKSRRADL